MIKYPTTEASDKFAKMTAEINKFIKSLNGRKIELEEYREMRLNSYEQKAIEPHLSDAAFLWKLSIYIEESSKSSCTFQIPGSYDDWCLTDGIEGARSRLAALVTSRDALIAKLKSITNSNIASCEIADIELNFDTEAEADLIMAAYSRAMTKIQAALDEA